MSQADIQVVDVHDPGTSAAQIARLIDHHLRALNYATRAGDPRLTSATEVYTVVGALREALAKLPQACHQLSEFLERQRDAGALSAVAGFPHAGRPVESVATAAAELHRAASGAGTAAAALGRAHTAVSGLADQGTVPRWAQVEPTTARRRDLHRVRTHGYQGPAL
jgi:hypothetical protein